MSSPSRTRPVSLPIFALAVVAVLVALLLVTIAAGINVAEVPTRIAQSLFPPTAVTEQGARIRDLYTIVFTIAAVIFFVVEGLIIWTVVRYRRRPGDDTLPAQTHGNMLAEVTWTLVPTIIVAFLFVVSWQTLNSVDTVAAQPELKVRAVAGQFQWSFDYLPADYDPASPNPPKPLFTQLAPTGETGGLFVPAGRSIQLYLVSNDVIHAFYVPQFLFKRDVVPGRINTFEFKVNASDAGQTFRGQCAELCGAGHAIMLFDVHALAGADFDAWLTKQQESANASPPPPSASPASGQPAPGASGNPGPGQSVSPAPSGGTGGDPTLQLHAQNVAYDQSSLTAPANTPFQIDFHNDDQGTPHNVAIHKDSPTGEEVWKGEIFSGTGERVYDVPALPAGTYGFVCSVHPNMTGSLTVQ